MPISTEELTRLAEVMDTLRSPGGCPWDAEQTHQSLLKYLLEEAYEFIDAVEKGNSVEMKEELGDLLLQVYFHARIAQERDNEPFTINDVAHTVAHKLVSRHPHVFGDAHASTSGEVKDNWETIKNNEKKRTTPIDGVPLGQPALPLAAKLIHRAARNKATLPSDDSVNLTSSEISSDAIGKALMAIAVIAHKHEIDPEAALRDIALRYAQSLSRQEIQN